MTEMVTYEFYNFKKLPEEFLIQVKSVKYRGNITF